jgi:hypothetical protein
MTFEEIATDVWELLGEPTDLEFRDEDGVLDPTSNGWGRLMRAARNAEISVSRWRNPRTGKRFRWYGGTETIFIENPEGVEKTVTAPGANGFNLSGLELLNKYATWYVRHQVRPEEFQYGRIISHTATKVRLFSDLSTALQEGDVVTLLPPYLSLPRPEASVLRVVYVDESRELSITRPEDILPTENADPSSPTRFYQKEGKIYLDRFPEEGVFQVEVDRMPIFRGNQPEARPELPDYLHYGMVLWMAAWGFSRLLNSDMKNAMRREYYEFMETVQLPQDSELDRQDDAFTLRRE